MDYETVGPEHRDVKDSLLPDMRVRYMHIGGLFFIAFCLFGWLFASLCHLLARLKFFFFFLIYSPDFYELGMCSHFYLSVLTCLVMKRW